MSEQQSQVTTATAQESIRSSQCGQPISAERQAKLQAHLDRWQAETDHGERKGPFDNGPNEFGVQLTGADVSWLAEQSERGEDGWISNLHLEHADLRAAHLETLYVCDSAASFLC